MKRKLAFYIIAFFVIWSCSKKDDAVKPTNTPVVADFTATVTGQAPNAKLTIVNTSTGATSYLWRFDKGANVASSSDKNPADLTIEKSGSFTVVLKASNATDAKEISKTVIIGGNSPVITFENVEFGLIAADASYGRLFSLETGKIYKDSELNSAINPKLNLAFSSIGNTMYYFESPTKETYNANGAAVTKVNNYPSDKTTITPDNFSLLTNDATIAPLIINETEESFGNSSIPGIIWFETATGRKGIIKTKAVNSSRILVDIKVQKY